jgi:hypothetical protein
MLCNVLLIDRVLAELDCPTRYRYRRQVIQFLHHRHLRQA